MSDAANSRSPDATGKKRVLEVGNCGPDHGTLSRYLSRHFAAQLVPVDDYAGAQAAIERQSFDLVIVNRKLDMDYSDGLEVIRQLKTDPKSAALPVMLLSNYADAQAQAMALGALPGFGKQQYHEPQTRERLAEVLGAPSAAE